MMDLDARDLRTLVETHDADPVLTLYLPVDPSNPENQRSRGRERWRVQLRNDLAALAREAEGMDRAGRARLEATVAQAEGFLSGYLPGGRTLTMLADEAGVLHTELPVVLPQRSGYGQPLVGGLVRAMSDHRLYAAVLVDQENLRTLHGYLGFVRDDASLELSMPYGMPGPTRSAHHFRHEARRDKYQRRFHASVADRIDEMLAEMPQVERLVVGGNETEAHGVARALSERAHQKLLGVVPVPLDSAEADVAARIAPHAERYEEQVDLEATAMLASGRRAGRVVDGPDAVLEALSHWTVQALLVSSHLSDVDLVESLALGAVRSGAAVRFVHRGAADELDGVGGVSARLYFASAG